MGSEAKLAKLEADLSRQRAAANKDQIWKCYRALGDFYVDRGELAPALKAFARMHAMRSIFADQTGSSCSDP